MTKIFEYSQDNNFYAHIGYDQSSIDKAFYDTIYGFKEIANVVYEHLSKQAEKDITSSFDRCYFPLAYLYRHCIEVSLKRLLYTITPKEKSTEGNIKLAEKFDINHDLKKLWGQILNNSSVKIALQKNTKNNDKVIKKLTTYIYEIDKIDCTGDKFRYLLNKNFSPVFKNKVNYSYQYLYEKMNYTMDYLEALLHYFVDFTKEQEKKKHK